ncbi:hypothetical protein [Lapidilactobacillus wuchangensis]|uniref:hypothetical protein n=1 Tax=Lapidilactobacillus wuchangensis TaxID=2486001 RepID=UPI000F789D5A|nr:hypothetical protein [Lapidilactobacillus wuchangensis]
MNDFKGTLDAEQLQIDFGIDRGQLALVPTGQLAASSAGDPATVNLLWQAGVIKAVTQKAVTLNDAEFGAVLTLPWAVDSQYLLPFLKNTLLKQPLTKLPANLEKQLVSYWQPFAQFLAFMNQTPTSQPESATGTKAKPAGKAVHRWRAAVAKIDFQIDYQGCQATARWVKRNEMVLAPGATLLADPPLNKDGRLGFSARFGQQLRTEHQTEYKNFVTTAPITLKSVNEVGLFLYFGGTNSWLVLHDDQGKTIHDWTVVEK